jgi:external thioesterase TEII
LPANQTVSDNDYHPCHIESKAEGRNTCQYYFYPDERQITTADGRDMTAPGSRDDIAVTLRPCPGGRQLVCFPYLGGYYGSFIELKEHCPPGVELVAINPPGHGPSDDPPLDDMDEMASLYLAALGDRLRPDAVFLGYSFGGQVLYRVARLMAGTAGAARPAALVIAASDPPHVAGVMKRRGEVGDDELAAFIATLGLIPPDLAGEKGLMRIFLKGIRADLKALQNVAAGQESIDIPAHIFFSENDPVTDGSRVFEWDRYFRQVTFVEFPGGHMFMKENPSLMMKRIGDILNSQ